MTQHSLWQTTAQDAPVLPTLDEALNCDVAVIGAGFTGLSTALHLAERGASVIVVDAESPGWGASGRNGGQVIAGVKYDPRELIGHFGSERGQAFAAFAGGTAGVLFDLVKRKAIHCDAIQNGWIQGATDRVGLRRVTQRVADWQAHGADVSLLDRDEARAMVGGGDYLGALLDRRGGHVQPLSLARGMARAALEAGARVFGDSPAERLTKRGDRWEVTTPRGRLTSDQVVIGTNGYTGGLWPGLARSVVATTSLQVATDAIASELWRTLIPGNQSVSETRNHLAYYRRHRQGTLVFGGSGGYRDPPAKDYAALVREARRYFPQLERVRFDYAWFGRFTNSPDHLPHLHVLAPGVYTWLGCNGRGVALATAMGPVLASLVAGAKESELPMAVTTPKSIPFHALKPVYVGVVSQLYALQDSFRRAVS